ncbi:hypothetical protein DFAR_3460050 [Desulfarculales bacterium]
MLREGNLSLLLGGSYDRASGQVVSLSGEAAGALLYGGAGRIREEVLFCACDFGVVQEVGLHVLESDAGQMAFGHHPGGQGQGGSVYEEVSEVVLTG